MLGLHLVSVTLHGRFKINILSKTNRKVGDTKYNIFSVLMGNTSKL